MMLSFAAFVLLLGGTSAIPMHSCKFLDMTHTLKKGVPHWGDEDFEFKNLVKGKFHEAEYVEANKFSMPEHFGTHVDAPSNFFPYKNFRMSDIPVNQMIGPACVFDITEKVKGGGENRNYGVSVEDIEEWEAANGKVPEGCIAISYSGWEFKWEDPLAFLGENSTDLKTMHYPGFSHKGGDLLINKRKVKAMGSDTLSFEPANAARDTPAFPVHHMLLGKGLLGYENLNNVHKLPPYGATVALLPLPIKDGSGSPIRGYAIGWDGQFDPCRLPPLKK